MPRARASSEGINAASESASKRVDTSSTPPAVSAFVERPQGSSNTTREVAVGAVARSLHPRSPLP
jgi:hypothetical protein